MKILAPTNSPKEIKQLIESGADELYCDVLSKEWNCVNYQKNIELIITQ